MYICSFIRMMHVCKYIIMYLLVLQHYTTESWEMIIIAVGSAAVIAIILALLIVVGRKVYRRIHKPRPIRKH